MDMAIPCGSSPTTKHWSLYMSHMSPRRHLDHKFSAVKRRDPAVCRVTPSNHSPFNTRSCVLGANCPRHEHTPPASQVSRISSMSWRHSKSQAGVDIHKIEFLTMFPLPPPPPPMMVSIAAANTPCLQESLSIVPTQPAVMSTSYLIPKTSPWPIIEATPPPAPKSCAS